jgi:hypothetical protein
MADQWLSIVEYARETGISDMTIRRRIRTGRISAELRDGKYFIPVTVDQANGQINPVKPSSRQNHSSSNSHAVIKAHPSPDRTIPRVIPSASLSESNSVGFGVREKTITQSPRENSFTSHQPPMPSSQSTQSTLTPDSLVKPLIDAGMASVEARGLIEFCHKALEQARSTVVSVEARYVARLEALNAQIAQKDQELKSLNQQVEDLQLLVQILERKK